MIERKSVIDQIEVTRTGGVQVRIAKLLVDDGEELKCEWHRVALPPDANVEATMAAVNQHLVTMGEAPLAASALDVLMAYFDFAQLHKVGE